MCRLVHHLGHESARYTTGIVVTASRAACAKKCQYLGKSLNVAGKTILEQLNIVSALRARRRNDHELRVRVQSIKAFQHRRFESTYADLLTETRYAPAARFFLNELYGTRDFTNRDDQFVRVVPVLVRMFPDNIVHTVALLSELHALSERLDNEMAEKIDFPDVNSANYSIAWRAVGQVHCRERQIASALQVGSALDQLTHKTLLRQSLRLMRSPAKRAGLGELQSFLEAGFDIFRAMHGADYFLETIAIRERAYVTKLFSSE